MADEAKSSERHITIYFTKDGINIVSNITDHVLMRQCLQFAAMTSEREPDSKQLMRPD